MLSQMLPKCCLNAADGPIKVIMNNSSANSGKKVDREPPVHTTDTFPARKRKSSSVSSDASITLPRKTNHVDDEEWEKKEKRTIITEIDASTAIHKVQMKKLCREDRRSLIKVCLIKRSLGCKFEGNE
jgi:hypothetical protein